MRQCEPLELRKREKRWRLEKVIKRPDGCRRLAKHQGIQPRARKLMRLVELNHSPDILETRTAPARTSDCELDPSSYRASEAATACRSNGTAEV